MLTQQFENMVRYRKGKLKCVDKWHIKKDNVYNDNIITFDIETTSAFLYNGFPIMFDYSKDKTFYKDLPKIALCYEWTLGVNDTFYYGRRLEEFYEAVTELREKLTGQVTIWVHNLSFEFQFLLNIFSFDKIFARTKHKVIYAEVDGIRFRCSYFLTRLSLDNWAKEKRLPVNKLSGFDYNKMRTPRTVLKPYEMLYCCYDCKVMYYGLLEYIEKYKYIDDIPLTQTGEVRKAYKKTVHKNRQYFDMCTNLLPKNAQEYALLKMCFSGGLTHANFLHSGKIIENVKSKDESSAYPYALVSEKYPMSKWQEIRPEWYEQYNNENYCLLVDVTFYNMQSKYYNTFISSSKCYEKKDCVYDNGRVVASTQLSLCCTGVDFDLMKKSYNFDKVVINRCYISIAKYLPVEMILFIYDLFKNKTELKGIDEMYALYMVSKQFINAMYGMCVTAILQEDVTFVQNEWKEQKMTIEDIDKGLSELRKKPFKNFLSYSWGVFCTAYARKNLWETILKIGNMNLSEDVIYYDTDSIKYVGDYDYIFNQHNKEVLQKLKTVADYYGIEHGYKQFDKDGKEHILGIFEDEKPYKEFITLGAKRYAYRYSKSEIGVTVSGVNKEKGKKELRNDLHNFSENMIFSYENSGRMIATYLDVMPTVTYRKGHYDEFMSKYRYGINLMPTTYEAGISYDYDFLLQSTDIKENFSDLSIEDLYVASTQQKESKRCRRNITD